MIALLYICLPNISNLIIPVVAKVVYASLMYSKKY